MTGASGFLGRAIVRSAAAAGHDVLALVRPASSADGAGWPASVRIVRGDLRAPDFGDELGELDGVIHAAAGTSGDLASQLASSLVATERLLALVDLERLERFVHVSSFSVYDFSATPGGDVIGPGSTAIEPEPARRDAYTTTKIRQEDLVRRTCSRSATPLVVLRPGVIFGEGNDWNWAAVGRVGRFELVASPRSAFRLTYVENCADAAVAALDAPEAPGATIDVVDDDLPTHAGFRRLAADAGLELPPTVPVPWFVLSAVGRVVDQVDRRLLGARAKLPEILELRRQQARWKPFRYSNSDAKRLLGWTPRVTMAEAVARVARHRDAS